MPRNNIDARDLGLQREWSREAFGPSPRLAGILEHLSKEIVEVSESPTDVREWVDIVILALDGAMRQGIDPSEIIEAYHAKVAENIARSWPDWRFESEDRAIEHVKEPQEAVVEPAEEVPGPDETPDEPPEAQEAAETVSEAPLPEVEVITPAKKRAPAKKATPAAEGS